ncbi:peptidoglycan/LPS O-acetylase OafA/YrhL [Curtobacterium sp. 320]|uniref:acyltransferase family protein n=1 Tax=Curtobacterium sp. 320 TaxID=2817749 RepID=UPI002862093F|nr:acyltransferase family protein [Curtobacterium sp. 320]MDR6572986.1 peptidoglycan/LPS O-acetylase OafA/YrhL [Curtobacterium sp. 320]
MTRTSPTFRPDIQGLRAIAVALVLLEHAHLGVTGGFVGVDVFFVISGFLITGHLIRELSTRGRIDLLGFWARRVRRILPSALLVALVTLAGAAVLMPPLVRQQLVEAGIAALLSIPNLYFAAEGTDYLTGGAPSPFQHFWSLGVEEQFYLLWPMMLASVWWLARRLPVRQRFAVITTTLAVAVVVSLTLGIVLTSYAQPWAFFSLPSRAWELGLGGVVAIAVHRGAVLRGRWTPIVGWLGLAGILTAALGFDARTSYPGAAILLPVLATAALVWAGASRHVAGPGCLLGLRPLQYLGGISYSLYLWHWPLLVVPQAAIGLATPLQPLARCVALAVAVVLAHVTTRFVERPLRTAGRRDGRVVLVGVTATVAAVAVTLAGNTVIPQPALTSQRTASPTVPAQQPRFTPFVPDNIRPRLDDATEAGSAPRSVGCHNVGTRDTSVNSCVLGDPSGSMTVAIVGDSHAAHWVPAVEALAARTAGMRVLAFTKNACTIADVPVRAMGRHSVECDTWRGKVLDRLRAEQPDVVLITGSAHLDLVHADDRATQWREGLARTLAALPRDSRVSVLRDTPEFAESVPRCLSANLENADACAIDRSEGLDDAWAAMERETAESAGHTYADLNDWFCSASRCGVISGDTLMYRDHGHLTREWARAMVTPIGEVVQAAR